MRIVLLSCGECNKGEYDPTKRKYIGTMKRPCHFCKEEKVCNVYDVYNMYTIQGKNRMGGVIRVELKCKKCIKERRRK